MHYMYNVNEQSDTYYNFKSQINLTIREKQWYEE